MRLERQAGFVVGIKCDLCGSEHENDFTYYSLDVREAAAVSGRISPGIGNLPVIFSLDLCVKCMNDAAERVRIHYAPTNVGANCDLCGVQMRGDFVFYYVDVSSVAVSMSRGAVRCSSCGGSAAASGCRCGGVVAKIAEVAVNDKYLQMVLCGDDYNRMVASAVSLRQTA